MIIDAHVHVWDARRLTLAWSAGGGHLEGTHESADYRREATPLGIDHSMLVEVDVVAGQRRDEAADQVARCASGADGILAAVPCCDPRAEDFLEQARAFSGSAAIRGIRWIARDASAAQELTSSPRVRRHLSALGELGLAFDLNVPMTHFALLPGLVRSCPGTRFVLDHFGYADPEAFRTTPRRPPTHEATPWLQVMGELASLPNVCCKVSGLANRLPDGDCTVEDIAPIVEHARAVFGAQRLLFGSDWPVVGPPGNLQAWVTALQALAARWSPQERTELFAGAAIRWYDLAALVARAARTDRAH